MAGAAGCQRLSPSHGEPRGRACTQPSTKPMQHFPHFQKGHWFPDETCPFSAPECCSVFHTRSSVFSSTEGMWEPHFQKCSGGLGACPSQNSVRRGPWHPQESSRRHSLEGAGEHARKDCSFLSLPLLPCNYNIPEWSGLEGSCKLIQFHCLP